MNEFCLLISRLNHETAEEEKINIINLYFISADSENQGWTLYLLLGQHPKRIASISLLKEWALDYLSLPHWLYEESFKVVKDAGETISLLLSGKQTLLRNKPLGILMHELLSMTSASVEKKKEYILDSWSNLSVDHLFFFNRLVQGNFHSPVDKNILASAINRYSGKEKLVLLQRFEQDWDPEITRLDQWLSSPITASDISLQAYPFCRAKPLHDPDSINVKSGWIAQYKYSGRRCQLIKSKTRVLAWSPNNDLITGLWTGQLKYTESIEDDFIIDGMILPDKSNKTKKNNHFHFKVFDILRLNGNDLREKTFIERQNLLNTFFTKNHFENISQAESYPFASWQDLQLTVIPLSRTKQTEGILFKKKSSSYLNDHESDWLVWTQDPLCVVAVMIYAERKSNQDLFTEFTFACYDDSGILVPITRILNGFNQEDLWTLNQWIKNNTLQRFGPVSSLRPVHIFQINFDHIASSRRHKSGISLKNPKIKTWLIDKNLDTINTLDEIKKWIL